MRGRYPMSYTLTVEGLPPVVRDALAEEIAAQRELGARVTLLMHEAHRAGRRTVTLRELLQAVGAPPERRLADAMMWPEMEWHDDWARLQGEEARP